MVSAHLSRTSWYDVEIRMNFFEAWSSEIAKIIHRLINIIGSIFYFNYRFSFIVKFSFFFSLSRFFWSFQTSFSFLRVTNLYFSSYFNFQRGKTVLSQGRSSDQDPLSKFWDLSSSSPKKSWCRNMFMLLKFFQFSQRVLMDEPERRTTNNKFWTYRKRIVCDRIIGCARCFQTQDEKVPGNFTKPPFLLPTSVNFKNKDTIISNELLKFLILSHFFFEFISFCTFYALCKTVVHSWFIAHSVYCTQKGTKQELN